MLATGLGLGCLPLLPGTAGALAGIVLGVAISRLRRRMQMLSVAVLVASAIPICHYGSIDFAGSDDRRIVADEMLTFPVATLALPVRQHPGLLVCVFFTSRVLDFIKPPPGRSAAALPGGAGIVLDDVAANAWTLLFAHIGWRLYMRRLKYHSPERTGE